MYLSGMKEKSANKCAKKSMRMEYGKRWERCSKADKVNGNNFGSALTSVEEGIFL